MNKKIKNFKVGKSILIFLAFTSLGVLGLVFGMNIPKLQEKLAAKKLAKENELQKQKIEKITEMVVPKEGFTFPISWGDLGPRLIKAGVIDEDKFIETVQPTEVQKKILTEGGNIPITINSENSQFVVDLLWAIGLAQKSVVYAEGPLGKEHKSEQGNFASTGGWTLAKGNATKYLNQFELIPLTPDQQSKVGEIAKNVYRPCCGNSTWFPDCNHGMAALAAIEMMVSKNMSDEEIYKNILNLNSFWFSTNYIKVAVYFDRKGVSWDQIDPKKILGSEFSSAQGAANTAKKVGPFPGEAVGGGSCGA